MMGCGLSTNPVISIDRSLLEPCQNLDRFDGENMGDLVLDSVNMAGKYKECAAGKAALIESIEKQVE